MNKRLYISIIILILVNTLLSIELNKTEILLKSDKKLEFSKNSFEDDNLNQLFKAEKIIHIEAVSPMSPGFNWYLVRTEQENDLDSIKSKAKDINNIKHIQRNGLSKLNIVPNDPLYSDQLAIMEMIKLPQAWDLETGSNQIIVGVVDSGILHLEDLVGNIFINHNEIPGNGEDNDGNGFIDDYMGYDFVDAPGMAHIAVGDYLDRDPDPTDENFHGTHVSGIIAADTNNGIGISGTAWNVKILPIRAGFRTAGGGGFLEDDDAAAALLYAANMGAHVINVSWGDSNFSQIIKDAIDYCVDRGVIVVCAAGNTPGGNINYPARFHNTIAVGAVDEYKRLAGFSSYGPELDVVAPGVQILSTYSESNNYSRLSGTSMAAPFVTGAIALLLSKEPGLDVFEVRNRLIASSEDLGAEGFDNFYGNGLLNVRALLETTISDIVEFSYPSDHQRFSNSFSVSGTVKSNKFLRYSVMYTNKQTPLAIDWKDVNFHTNSPAYFYEQVENDVLANFYLPTLFDDGLYRLRIRLYKTDGTFIDKFLIFFIDREIPVIVEESIFYQKRYNKQNAEHFIFSLWNKTVSLNMEYLIGDNSFHTASVSYDSVHILQVDNNYMTGDLKVRFTATDLSGIQAQTQWFDLGINIVNEEIPNHIFKEIELGQGLVLAKNTIDFNHNNKQEFIAMKAGEGIYGDVFSYEFQQNALVQTYYYSEGFWPLDVYRKTNGRSKVASLRGDVLQIYESLANMSYPDFPLWSVTDATGAIFADFTNNGRHELIVVRNLLAEIGIEIYDENTNGYTRIKTLSNPTPTSSRRMFIPKIQSGNLDNDAYTDLLTADTDGDLMIWEYIDGEPVLSWSHRLPIRNVYFLNIADYTGDGLNEFIAGGYVTAEESNKTWWYFEMFKSTDDNEYSSLGNISFSTVKTAENSIFSIDFDNDGKKELIFAVTPYLYVIKYTENGLKPIHWTYCDNSYQIAGMDSHSEVPSVCIFNRTVNDELRSFALLKDIAYTGPAIPENLNAFIINNNTIKLEWDECDVDYYEIFYRNSLNDDFILKGQAVNNYFIDDFNAEDKLIEYKVRSISTNFSPEYSNFSYSYTIYLSEETKAEYVKMISDKALLLAFTNPISMSSVNNMNYYVNNNVGYPSSVHFFDENKTLYLKFFTSFPDKQDLKIDFKGLKDKNNRAIQDSSLTIKWNIDTEPPYVTRVDKINESSFALIFSELLDIESAININNYILETPIRDIANQISSVSLSDSIVTITLTKDIIKVTDNYYLKMLNIKDLAGNVIKPSDNRISLNLTEITDLSLLVVYPNPLNLNNSDAVKFRNLPSDKKGEIKIFNMAGELVFRKRLYDSNQFNWLAKNQKGQNVASGMYYYIISYDGENIQGKLAVIR